MSVYDYLSIVLVLFEFGCKLHIVHSVSPFRKKCEKASTDGGESDTVDSIPAHYLSHFLAAGKYDNSVDVFNVNPIIGDYLPTINPEAD